MKLFSASAFSVSIILLLYVLVQQLHTQQTYNYHKVLNCDENNDASTKGYVCNNSLTSCLTYFTVRSQPPYDSAWDIGYLWHSEPSVIARINNIAAVEKIPTNTQIVVPVNCSCSGGSFYQQNSSYIVKLGDTYQSIANGTYQGFTTCQAMMNQNPDYKNRNLSNGLRLSVPLRCACPSLNQEARGVKFLLSFVVAWGDTISSIGATFGVDVESILDANKLKKTDFIFPFTTILIPLKAEPRMIMHQTTIKKRGNSRKTFAVATIASGVVIVALTMICYLAWRSNTITLTWKRKTKNAMNVETFLRNCGPLALKRYHYEDVKKMTKSFTEKIGKGGYGSVFKGKSPDGKMVAVKVLSETKGDGSDFINEVASISRTSHINIVTLLGFCIEGPKRALIYDFMPNGSLERFIFNGDPENLNFHLGWEKLWKVAIGIAHGLEYLHSRCNTRILHFDIKPHNILLDQDFTPKIADFGLSKLCHVKESLVSMTGARGTPGYIAPEVVSRNFGDVSHKSDVYSYGMMVLEMVGGRKNIDVRVNNPSEIYFPHWIYKRLNLDEDLGLHGINPQDRPPMSSVGNVRRKL